MEIGEIFDVKKIKGRQFDINEIYTFIRRHFVVLSWGIHNPQIVLKDTLFRFKVNGNHHKGWVYIMLDWSDTFTIYYVSSKNEIKNKREIVYIDQLVDLIDNDVEKLPSYVI